MSKKIIGNLKNEKKLLNFISIACSSIVPLMVTGPFLPDLLMSLLVIWFLIFSFKKKIFFIYNNNYFIFFIFFCFLCIISSIFSENIFFSFQSSLFYFRIGIFAILISYLIEKNQKILIYFYYSFLIIFFIIGIDSIIQYLFSKNLFGMEPITNKENLLITSLFGDEPIMGSFISRLFLVYYALFYFKKKTKYDFYLNFILIIILNISVFLSGSRVAILIMSLSMFFIIFIELHKNKLRFFSFLISLSIIFFILITNEKIYSRIIVKTINELNPSYSDRIYFYSQAHDNYLFTSINMFKDKPLIGHGPKFYRIKCDDKKYKYYKNSCSTHPHNFYAQLLAETGILGFLMISIFFILIIYRLIKLLYFDRVNYNTKCITCFLLFNIFVNFLPIPTGNFFNNQLMLFYSLSYGFNLYFIRLNIKKKP